MEIKRTKARSRQRFNLFNTNKGIDSVDIYFNEIDKLDVENWDIMKAKHVDYQNARDAFNSVFTQSNLVKTIIATSSRSNRFFKPPKQNNEHYDFPYTYLAVAEVIERLEPYVIEYYKIGNNDTTNLVSKYSLQRGVAKRLSNEFGLSARKSLKEAINILTVYRIMIDKRNDVVMNDLRLVINIANNFKHNPSQSMGFADVIQEGNLGLVKTIESFDVNNNVRFPSYGVIGIVNQIKRSLTAKSWTIRLPEKIIKNGYIVTKVKKRLIKQLNRQPTIAELAVETEIPEDDVVEILETLHKYTMLDSIDELTSIMDYNEDSNTGEVAVVNALHAEEEDALDFESFNDTTLVLDKLVAIIGDKLNISSDTMEVVRMKLGLFDGLKFSDEHVMTYLDIDNPQYQEVLRSIRHSVKGELLMSRYLVLSDTHFGSDDDVDNFSDDKAKLFNKLIDWKNRNKIDKTLLLGDIWELWQGKGWGEKGRLKNARKRYSYIWNNIKHWTNLAGNHDWYVHDSEKVPEHHIIEENGMKIVFIHGHQFDSYFGSKTMTTVSRVATEFWGIVEKTIGTERTAKILPKLEKWLERQKMVRNGNGRDHDGNEIVKQAVQFAKEHKATHIVYGHTHNTDIQVVDGITCIDTGTWIDKYSDIVIIDTKTKKVLLTNFTQGISKKSTSTLLKEAA